MTSDETVREVCAEMKELSEKKTLMWCAQEYMSAYSSRVLSAYEREMAEKDARIALLEHALKPVMELDVPSVVRLPSIGEPKIIRDLYYAQNAVRDAQRIMKESYNGESHN